MTARRPASLILTLGLTVLAFAAAGTSLGVQGLRTDREGKARATELTGGDPDKGRLAIPRYGCNACHEIPGLKQTAGAVGPSLGGLASRAFVGGRLANRPDQMMLWIRHPQAVIPGVGMPDQAMSDADARNIAAYLYTLQ